MPGLLKPTAACPMCKEQLVAIVDTSSARGVTREYFHLNRRTNHKRHFWSFEEAKRERARLEVRPSARVTTGSVQ